MFILGIIKMKNILKILGISGLFGSHLVMVATFYVAYFNPGKSAEIFINRFKEANLEIVLITALTFIGGWAVWSVINELAAKDARKKRLVLK